MYSEDCDFTSSTPQVCDAPPSSSECSSLRASQMWGEGVPPNTCNSHKNPLPTHTGTHMPACTHVHTQHTLSLLTSWRAAASPLLGGPFPGLWRLEGVGWGPDPGSGRDGALSTEGHMGTFCTGTQSDPAILCSQTASAMYLGSNKTDGRRHGPPARCPSVWGAHSPCLALQPAGTSLMQAVVPLYHIS